MAILVNLAFSFIGKLALRGESDIHVVAHGAQALLTLLKILFMNNIIAKFITVMLLVEIYWNFTMWFLTYMF